MPTALFSEIENSIYVKHIWATAGRMRPSTSFDLALIHFSELTHIKLTSYDLLYMTKASFVTVQNLVIDLRRYFPCNKFKRGNVCKKWWSADHGLLAMDTLALLVGTLALIMGHISFLKAGRAAATVNVSEFRKDILWGCVLSSVLLSVDADFLKQSRR
jgi:hypothetical protein